MAETVPLSAEDAAYMIKARLRDAVRLAGGGTFVAAKLGLSPGFLSKVQSPQYSEQIQPGLIPVIEAMAGSPIVTEGLAEAQGFRLVQGGAAAAGIATLEDLTRVIGQSGDFLTTFSDALADRVIDAHEQRELHTKIEDLIASLRGVQGKIRGAGQ